MDGYEDVIVRACDVAGYMNEEFYQAMYGWSMVKKWGLPIAGGWAQQPKTFMDAIDVIENAYNQWEHEQMEKDKPKVDKPDVRQGN